MVLLALIFINGGYLERLLEKMMPSAFLIDNVFYEVLLAVVSCEDGDVAWLVALQDHVHIGGNNEFCFLQVLVHEWSGLEFFRFYIDHLGKVLKSFVFFRQTDFKTVNRLVFPVKKLQDFVSRPALGGKLVHGHS